MNIELDEPPLAAVPKMLGDAAGAVAPDAPNEMLGVWVLPPPPKTNGVVAAGWLAVGSVFVVSLLKLKDEGAELEPLVENGLLNDA